MTDDDRLKAMWEQQREFMHLLQEKRGFPPFPTDLASKDGQKRCKQIAFDVMGELFEAVQTLKNSKDHRATNVVEFDRAHYIEEIVDAVHFAIELAIFSGISQDELFEAYMQKGDVNTKRIKEGY